VAMTLDDYRQQLLVLLPPSDVLDISDGSQLHSLLDAMSAELARVDGRVDDLLRELDPRSASELLNDWETELGLPSACAPLAISLGERRDAAHAKLTERGGQSRQYFIDLAAKLGFTVTITEFKRHTVRSGVNQPLFNQAWAFWFRINAPATTIRVATVRSGVDEPLRSWGNELLECAIDEDKPAHTQVLYAYG